MTPCAGCTGCSGRTRQARGRQVAARAFGQGDGPASRADETLNQPAGCCDYSIAVAEPHASKTQTWRETMLGGIMGLMGGRGPMGVYPVDLQGASDQLTHRAALNAYDDDRGDDSIALAGTSHEL